MARLAVVVPCRDAPQLELCLRALRTGSRRPDELIVVDDGSRTAPWVPSDVQLLRQPHRGPAVARNAGVRLTTAEILIFVDADVEVRTDTLARFEALLHREPAIAAVQAIYAADCPVPTFAARLQNVLQRENLLAVGDTLFAGLSSFCVALRREAFESVGGFDERFDRPTIEDDNLGLALAAQGRRIVIARDIEVRHHARPTVPSLLLRMVRMAEDRVQTAEDAAVLPTRTHHRPELLVATGLMGLAMVSSPAVPVALALSGAAIAVQSRWLKAAKDTYGTRFAVAAAPMLAALPAAAAIGVRRGLARRLKKLV